MPRWPRNGPDPTYTRGCATLPRAARRPAGADPGVRGGVGDGWRSGHQEAHCRQRLGCRTRPHRRSADQHSGRNAVPQPSAAAQRDQLHQRGRAHEPVLPEPHESSHRTTDSGHRHLQQRVRHRLRRLPRDQGRRVGEEHHRDGAGCRGLQHGLLRQVRQRVRPVVRRHRPSRMGHMAIVHDQAERQIPQFRADRCCALRAEAEARQPGVRDEVLHLVPRQGSRRSHPHGARRTTTVHGAGALRTPFAVHRRAEVPRSESGTCQLPQRLRDGVRRLGQAHLRAATTGVCHRRG